MTRRQPSVSPVLDDLGPFFALEPAPPDTPTQDGAEARQTWTGEIRRVEAALADRTAADVPTRVAAASVHLTACARLVAPALALLVATDQVPDLGPSALVVQPGSVGLRYATTGGLRDVDATDPDAVVEAFTTYVLPGVARLTALVEADTHLGPAVTTSNAASTLHNSGNAMALTRPDLARRARPLVPVLLDRTWLGDGAEVRDDGAFRRRGCCLYYRLPGGGVCGDCVLVDQVTSAHG